MKKTLISMLIILIYSNSNAQFRCVKVDSLVLKSVPWNTSSPIAIKENDLNATKSLLVHKQVINKKEVIESFLNINLSDSTLIQHVRSKLDVRGVIEIYSNGQLFEKVVISKNRFYNYYENQYHSSIEFRKWQMEYFEK